MEKFEKYHPILTPHFTLDWLTASKVKDIFELRHDKKIAALSGRDIDEDIEQTATYVNRTMHAIMNNEALLWGILDRRTDKFLGTLCIWHFNDQKNTAEIRFEVLADQQNQGIMSEVLGHMSSFAFAELGLKSLYAITQAKNGASQAVLKKNHFQLDKTDANEKGTLRFYLNAPNNEA